MRRAQPPDFSQKNVACHALRIGVCELEGSLHQRITTTTNQICSGSSGSGSRTGASGFSIGEGGSLIGGGIGSAGVRRRKGGSVGIPNFVSSCMAFRCQVGFKGSRTPNAALRTSDHPAEALLALSLPLLLLPANHLHMPQGRHQRQPTNHIAQQRWKEKLSDTCSQGN